MRREDTGNIPCADAFFRQIDDAFERVDALFGEQAQGKGARPLPEAALASLTAAAVLILRGLCRRASFAFPGGTAARLGTDKSGRLRIERRRENGGARG